MNNQKESVIEKIINYVLDILIFVFGIVLLISLYISIQTKVFKNDYANFFGYSIFEVQTGSMSGTIEAGDWIIVDLSKKPKLNDIVTYESNGNFITLPASGYCDCNGNYIYMGLGGYYWSSTMTDFDAANYIFFDASKVSVYSVNRCNKFSVRIVK